MKRFTAICAAFLVCLSVSCTEKKADKETVHVQSPKTEEFKQPKSLAELLALSPESLEKVDVARIDLLCAEGLNGSENLDVELCVNALDAWARDVEDETKRNQHLFDEHPERFKNSLAYYRMAMLATVLVQDLKIQYSKERLKQLDRNGHLPKVDDEEKKFFGDSKDVFIHGLLGGNHYGTCASMPYLYVAIGRRLSYPVTLAATSSHCYLRYEEGNGKHFNIEATEHRAFLTPSDDEYKNQPELELNQEEIDGFGYLSPMSNKDILATTLVTRSGVLRSMKQYEKQAEALKIAYRYMPKNILREEAMQNTFQRAKREDNHDQRNKLWDEVMQIRIPTGPGLVYFQNKKVQLHFYISQSMNMEAVEKAVKDFKSELGRYEGDMFELSHVPQQVTDATPRLMFRYHTADGKVVQIPADFLPPFERRMIPEEIMDRIADQKIEDGDLILDELWKYYDDTVQAQRRAELQKISQSGAGQILIAQERVPQEYRDGIPDALQIRLKGMKNEQDIVNEMWAFQAEQEARRHDEEYRERILLTQRYGVRSDANPQVDIPDYMLPPEYRNSMPLELKLRLANKQSEGEIRNEIDHYRLDAANRQNAERAKRLLHSPAGAGLSTIRLVPASTLNLTSGLPSVPTPAELFLQPSSTR